MSLSQHSFDAVSDMFHSVSGIRLTAAKKPLVEGRLQKLARDRGLKDVEIYVRDLLKQQDRNEIVRVVDKLTTNETYFFREPAHFEFLDEVIKARRSRDLFRVWSGASSSGEEAYSIAMLLGDRLGSSGWEIIGTDLSTDMVATAQRGLYPMSRAKGVSPAYLKRFCLKGHGEYEGHLLISKELRKNVHMKVSQAAGVDCTIVLVAPRSLPFTSSGKLSRAGARDRFLSGEIAEVAGTH